MDNKSYQQFIEWQKKREEQIKNNICFHDLKKHPFLETTLRGDTKIVNGKIVADMICETCDNTIYKNYG